ncbi:MAG: tetratricopeptide repeat protein, partial [Spirochaetota bacterium]
MGVSPVKLIIMLVALPLAGEYYRSVESIIVPGPTKKHALIADETNRTRELTAILEKARTALASGNTAAAIRICEEAHAVYANHPFTYRILSEAYAASGDHYRALNYAQKGIDYDNRYLPNYEMLADAYVRFNEFDRSIQAYLTAYHIELISGYFLAKAGMLFLSLGELPGAERYFEKGATNDDPYCIEGKGIIALRSNDYASALASFERAQSILEKFKMNDARIPAAKERLAARIVRTKYDWLLALMEANYERGNDAKVMELGGKAVSLVPEYRAFMLSGLSAARAGDLTNAFLFLTQATNVSPRVSIPYRTLAGVYARFGRTNDAVDVLREGARNCRTDQELYVELSQYLIQTGNYDEADAAFKRALLFTNIGARSLASYARILFGKGDLAAAGRYAIEAEAIADRAAMNDIARRAAIRMQLEKARTLIRDKAPQRAMDMLQTTNYTGQEESLRVRYMLLAYDALGRIDEPIAFLMRGLKSGISLLNAREIMYFANKFLELHRTNETSWPVAKRKYAEIARIVDAWMINDGMRPALLSAYFDDIIAYGDHDTAIHVGTLMKKNAAFDPAKAVARAQYQKGRAAFADNRAGDAKEALLKALASDDDCHDARFLLNEMHAAEAWRALRDAEDIGDTTNTVRAYGTILSLTPYDASPLLPLARAYREKGDFSNALAIADEIRQLAPEKGLGHELAGDTHLSAGNALEALKAYREAMRIEPDNPVYRRKAARCFFALEQYTRAAVEFEALIRTDGVAENWFYYGAALYHLWEYPDAIAAMEKAVMAEPGNPVYRMNYGVILLEAGRTAEALEAFNHSLLIDASSEDTLFYKARALFYLGRIDESFTIAERLATASPENPLYRFALGAIYELRSRQILASDVAEYINRAIVQFTQCVSLCKPVRDDELKQEALKRLKDLNPNFHVIAIAQLPAALAAPLANDPKDRRIVYAPLANGTVCAYDVIGNKALWQTRVAGRVTSPVVYRARHVMFGTESGVFHILRAKDGTSAFTFVSGGPITQAALPIVNNNNAKEGGDEVNIILVPSDDGRVYLIQYLEDEDRFNYQFIQMEGGISTPIVHENGLLFYATARGSIYCMNMRTGKTKWVQRTSGRVTAAPLIVNGSLYAASDDGIIYRLSLDDGGITGTYRYRNSGVKELVHKDGYLFFGDDFGRFHIIDTDMKSVGIDQLNGA